jgi:hypothetical protein
MRPNKPIIVEALYKPTFAAYQLIDRTGRVAMVRQDLIHDNQLELVDGQIQLTASQYEAWFKVMEEIKLDESLFRPNIYRFFQNRSYLLTHPEIANKYSTEFGAFSYCSVSPSLGALALSFQKGERTLDCQYCGEKAHLFRSVGSVLSGYSSQNFICENVVCQRVNTKVKTGMKEVIVYFKKLQESYLELYPNAKQFDSMRFEEILAALPA